MPEKTHVGFKGTMKFLGWIIGAIIVIFDFIVNWLPATAITTTMIAKILTEAAVAAIGVPAVFYIGDILWTLAHKFKELIFE